MTEIKPCPFCGGKGAIKSKVVNGKACIFIMFSDCYAAGPIYACPASMMPKRITSDSQIFKPVIEQWNRRT